MIPTSQDHCDPDSPDVFAVWALRSLPAPIRPKVSRELWDAGFRHHPELQTVKYADNPMLAALGAHAPAEPVQIKKDDARRMLADVNPALAEQIENADDAERSRLKDIQRAKVKELQDKMQSMLGDQ